MIGLSWRYPRVVLRAQRYCSTLLSQWLFLENRKGPSRRSGRIFFFPQEICRQFMLQEKMEIKIKGSSSFCYVLPAAVLIYSVVSCVESTSRWIGSLLFWLGGIIPGHNLKYSQLLHTVKHPLWVILSYNIWSLMEMHELRFLNFSHTLENSFIFLYYLFSLLFFLYKKLIEK